MTALEEALYNAHNKLAIKIKGVLDELAETIKELNDALEEESAKEYVASEEVKERLAYFKEQLADIETDSSKFIELHDSLVEAKKNEAKLQEIDPFSYKDIDFIKIIKNFTSYSYSNIETLLKNATKLTHMGPFKNLDMFKEYCLRVNSAKLHVITHTNKSDFSIKGDKPTIAIVVKNLIGSNEVLINDFISYLEKLIGQLSNKKTKLEAELEEYKEKEAKRFVDEAETRFKALLEKKEAIVARIGEFPEASYMYREYMESTEKDPEKLKELIALFIKLGVLTQREVDKITYEKQEKVEEVEEIKEEKPVEVKQKEVKELDLEYYLRQETQNIICFLGEDGNDIYDDLYSNFDNNLRPKVLEELVLLFKKLYLEKDPDLPTGILPIPSESTKKTRSLLRKPFGFAYRRFFTGGKDYRMHAIVRHSNLLEDLGYGSGNIIFFGSLGLNKDEDKDTAYSMVGRRAIEKKTSKNGISRLKPNFDYIEHITRSYIPKSLLSENDKNRIKTDFLGTIVIDDKKIDKSIENGEYVYYYLLDDESKNNVYTYLNKYFMKQSNIMFKFIKELEDKKKDSSLD